MRVKLAVTVFEASMTTVVLELAELAIPAPSQFTNCQPTAGVAVMVAFVPWL
jgi:hypothetical protein